MTTHWMDTIAPQDQASATCLCLIPPPDSCSIPSPWVKAISIIRGASIMTVALSGFQSLNTDPTESLLWLHGQIGFVLEPIASAYTIHCFIDSH